ncbi:hypothetical protein DPMN_032113 [Dreissena polymorpha]|uniref:Uncharacterized protein n=1 Tax=Dreissena polymorpha TaxID=45954 RepID=A0A9D4M295_DREPO|nr:hypothetical protein DPMN_032113 [Dreissena polymorpha]
MFTSRPLGEISPLTGPTIHDVMLKNTTSSTSTRWCKPQALLGRRTNLGCLYPPNGNKTY